jgi:ElaB/YqjD/DUF883 family membrane-anchored ribosome-binding protein
MKNNQGTEGVLDELNDAAEDAADMLETGETGEKLHNAKARLASALDAAKATYYKLEEKAIAGAKATDRTIREHPYQSMGIAFGVGILIGVLVTRNHNNR